VGLFAVGLGLLYSVLALRHRRNWARYAAVVFWLLCLLWSVTAAIRNGLHPEPAKGYFEYSNEGELEGARLSTLVTPYVMAMLESAALYSLLWRARVVNRFATASAPPHRPDPSGTHKTPDPNS
jgi:hypothetical protein